MVSKKMDVPAVTKKRIADFLSQGKRFDGRKPFEHRDLTIETGISNKAEGSARVKLGNTEVLVGVKLGMSTPFGDSPDSGTLMVTAEFSPMASEKFERGPPSIESVELARIIDRGIRESEFIDLDKLCVKSGEQVWSVFIDIYPINDDGNLIGAASIGAIAALKSAVLPKVEDDKILFGEFTTKKLPLNDAYPVNLTFYKIGNNFLIDPTTEEEEASETKLSIAVSNEKKEDYINAMQKGGDATFSIEDVATMLDVASKEAKALFKAVEEAVK